MGGVLGKEDKMFHGFDELYRQGETGGGPLAPVKKDDDQYHIDQFQELKI